MDPKISAIIGRNDALISVLESLRRQNEHEMILYKQIETSMPWNTFKMNAFHQSREKTENDQQLEQERLRIQSEHRAARIIQKAYRKHLFKLCCERRKESWEHVGIPDRLRYINHVSNNASKINLATSFNFKSWKDKFHEFESGRQRRAKIFEKQNQLLKILKDEQDFIRGNKELEDLPEQKPYIHQKAIKDMQWMLEKKEKEAVLLLL